MQAVPMWMPMTTLPRDTSPSLHGHALFSPDTKDTQIKEDQHRSKQQL